MKFHIKTYGCQMNERDSDSAAALLIAAGHQFTADEEDADIFILNTCSVREQAERKAIGKLGIMKRLKEKKPDMIFGIMGCMAQSRGEELLQSIHHLDFAVGTDQIHMIPELVEDCMKERKKSYLGDRTSPDSPGIDSHRFEPGEKQYSAFVSIMRGCSRFCSYCIVPFVRGPERSRDAQSIIEECKMLAERGVKEIMLLGQNVAAYGMDNTAPPPPPGVSPFADLLEEINKIDGLCRIRFTSPHPAFFNDRLIQAVAELPKVCKCVHLPLQSGSDPVLKRMNRPYTAEQYLHVIRSLRNLVPDITFSTDVIVGFPGETEEDFNETRRVMAEAAYDNAYIFKYSPRKGTKSAKWEDDVPQEVKEERNRILLEDMEQALEKRNRALSGRVFDVLAEGPSKRNPNRWQGRTDTFKNVVFLPPPGVKEGDIIPVKIARTTAMTLYGEIPDGM